MTPTAVLIIDVQWGLFVGPPDAYRGPETIAKINALIAHARDRDLPVIFVQHDGAHESAIEPESEGWRLHPALHRQAQDIVVRKTASDAFDRTALAAQLDARGVRRLLIAGYATEFCVDTSVRRAASLGYDAILVADAHTTKDRPTLTAEQIIAHHAWVLHHLDCPEHPIRVVKLDDNDWSA